MDNPSVKNIVANYVCHNILHTWIVHRGKHIGALAPHPYAIADTAYRALASQLQKADLKLWRCWTNSEF